MDVLLIPEGCEPEVCTKRFVVEYGRYFLETALNDRFHDDTRPDISRFLLKETDLPAP